MAAILSRPQCVKETHPISCGVGFISANVEYIGIFIARHWNGTGTGNPPPLKTMIRLSFIVNIMADSATKSLGTVSI